MTVSEMEESNAWGLLLVGVNSSQTVGLLIYWGTTSTLDIDLGSIPVVDLFFFCTYCLGVDNYCSFSWAYKNRYSVYSLGHHFFHLEQLLGKRNHPLLRFIPTM